MPRAGRAGSRLLSMGSGRRDKRRGHPLRQLTYLNAPIKNYGMPVVRFSWNPRLVEVRRQCCPQARWDKRRRAWAMTTAEAEAFVVAAHSRLEFCRLPGEIMVDGERWIVGFVQGAPSKIAQRQP